MKQYEYRVLFRPKAMAMDVKKFEGVARQVEQELNHLGEDGWEFFLWKNSMMFFKRERLPGPENGQN